MSKNVKHAALKYPAQGTDLADQLKVTSDQTAVLNKQKEREKLRVNPSRCQNCTRSLRTGMAIGSPRKPCRDKPCLEREVNLDLYDAEPVAKRMIDYSTGKKKERV